MQSNTLRAGLGLALALAAPLAHAQIATPAAAPAEETVTLNPFTVSAERNRGYQASNVQAASKLALPIKDVAQTVTVLTGDFLKDISASNLTEAMAYVTGVVANGGARNQDGFTIRGFNQPLTYVDGFRDGQEWASGENAHVAQLEILKGPASNLYGNGRGFGGIINRVTKKPQAQSLQALELSVGTEDFLRATYDVTGPISEDKSWLYRVNAAYTHGGNFRDGIGLDRYFISPVITKKLGAATEITLYLEFLRTETAEDLGIPSIVDATRPVGQQRIAPNIPLTRNFGENWEETVLEKESARVLVTHNLTDNWTLRASGNLVYFNNPITQIEALSVSADNTTLNRRGFTLNRWEDHLIGELDVLGKFTTGPLKHNLLVGYEYNREIGRSNVRRAPLSSISIANPVYGAARPDFYGAGSTVASNLKFQNGIYGAFIGDQVSLLNDKLSVFGLRHDRATSKRDVQLPGGTVTIDPANKKTAPRYGFVFKPVPTVSVYAQYSEAFRPIFGATTPTFDALKPETGVLKEVGIKTTWLNGRLGFDVAGYEIEVKDLAIRLDPPNNSFFRNGGVTQGNGTEVNLSYNDANWNLIAGYLNQDVRDVVVAAGVPLGAQGQPKNMFDLFGKYTWREGALKGFSLGGGVIYFGDRNFNSNTGVLDAFTRLDLMASYTHSPTLIFALNVKNVSDEEYFFNAAGFMLRPAEPLTARLTVRWQF
jgi:iron complex outermembrane recepter protein